MKTKQIRNILVPVDFSELSVQAVEHAKAFADQFGAVIHLAHVHQFFYPAGFTAPMPTELPFSVVDYEKDMEKSAMKQLRELAVRCRLPSAAYHVRMDAPAYDALCNLAREIPADLMVMPTHGHTGLKRLFLGSTAERVVQHAPCPVFVVRAPEKTSKNGSGDLGIKTVLVPVDFSRSSFEGLQYAIGFAKKFGAKIIVHHVIDFGPIYLPDRYGVYDLSKYREIARQNAKEQMRKFVEHAQFGGIEFETAITVGPAVWEICGLSGNRNVDLIITSTHGRTGFKHVLIGSTAECLVRQAPCSVLVVPSHPEVRAAHLTRPPANESRPTAQRPHRAIVETEKLTRKYRKRNAHPFPERRATNKFRESHALR